MNRLLAPPAQAACLPTCWLRHSHLALSTSDCARIRELFKYCHTCGHKSASTVQAQHAQRALGERAFWRATGQTLPAIVQVRPPDAAPFALVLLEVFPDVLPNGDPRWQAGGYLWTDGTTPGTEWRVVELDHVRFEEPFVRCSPRRAKVAAWLARARTFVFSLRHAHHGAPRSASSAVARP